MLGAGWWLPDDIVLVEEMSMTGSGKIQKTALREQFKHHRLPADPGGEGLRPAQ